LGHSAGKNEGIACENTATSKVMILRPHICSTTGIVLHYRVVYVEIGYDRYLGISAIHCVCAIALQHRSIRMDPAIAVKPEPAENGPQ